MTGLNLDALRQQWTAQSEAVHAQLHWDVDALRSRLQQHTRRAFRRHSYGLLAALAVGACGVLALFVFMLAQRHEPTYLLAALPLLAIVLAEFAVDLRQWRDLATLDFSAPVLQVRERLAAIRTRRLRMVRAIALSAVLLWWPLVMVVLKAAFAVDLLQWLHPSVLVVNGVIGLAVMPLLLLAAHALARRYAHSPGWQRLLDDLAGRGWQRAQTQWQRQQQFEQDLLANGAAVALQARQRAQDLSPAVLAARRALRWRIDLGIALYVFAIGLTGVFNAQHGGQLTALLAGIPLHLAGVSLLVGAILQRQAMATATPDDASADWPQRLQQRSGVRARLLRGVLALSPLLSMLLAQVVALTVSGVDLVSQIAPGLTLSVGLLAAIASAMLSRRWQQAGHRSADTLANALSLGALQGARDLGETLERTKPTGDDGDA